LTLEEMNCWNCKAKIIPYYHEEYKGKRGKCPICGTDFPLE